MKVTKIYFLTFLFLLLSADALSYQVGQTIIRDVSKAFQEVARTLFITKRSFTVINYGKEVESISSKVIRDSSVEDIPIRFKTVDEKVLNKFLAFPILGSAIFIFNSSYSF